MLEVVSDLISESVANHGSREAICHKTESRSYLQLQAAIESFSSGIKEIGINRGDRVAIYAGKQIETVVAIFGTSHANAVFVPVNMVLKAPQVEYILRDCNVRMLVTTAARAQDLAATLDQCPELDFVVILDDLPTPELELSRPQIISWTELSETPYSGRPPRRLSSDVAAIMYTSGSTGKPKGVVLSHNNVIVGAQSVAAYIGNSPSDRILSVLPLSFDAGLSQLTTGFVSGSTVVLLDYLLPRDIVRIIEKQRITGITGVPPLWMQLTDQDWSTTVTESVRYFANTGGKMPRETLKRLRDIFPKAKPYLMYGLTEAFRSTYLPPSEVDNRPDSIGKAIPHAEILVVNPSGQLCAPGEVGELVHRGPLVSLGYWNDPDRTAARFRPVPGQPSELPLQEFAVFSGDSVKMDEEGFLYFVGRMDDMIKTSGYRVSPAEIEEVVFDTQLVSEVAAIGIPHPRLGQGIIVVAKPEESVDHLQSQLLDKLRPVLPNYMIPLAIFAMESLPRNANGKIDRKLLAERFANTFELPRNEQ